MPRRRIETTKVDHLLDELLQDASSPEEILGEQGLLKQLTKRLMERALAAELSHHLAQEHQTQPPEGADPPKRNSRNGYSKKTVKGELGELEVSIPRDRQSTFEPIILPKGERTLRGLDEKILALYARGNGVRDIQACLEELYGIEVSPSLISQVTDAVSEEVRQWQNRPLDALYPIVYLDALHVKVRDAGKVSTQAVHVALGITMEGNKEVLGLWMSQNEGAKFWLQVLTELKNRGIQDIFIACVDGLTGFPDAIATVFPQTKVQLCIVHLIRNALRYVSWKDRKAVAADLKPIYKASTVAEAEAALDAFAQKWDQSYPAISALWMRHWENVIPFFDYPEDIRKVIYTTNAIESLNRSLRKVIKTKGAFPSPDAVFKLLYLALNNIAKKWTKPILNWNAALARFAIEFPDRFPL